MRRNDWVVMLGWPVLGLGELWFARQGFTTHGPDQWMLELVGLTIIGACQARFAPDGWARSPLWCGVVALAWTAMVLGPSGLTGLVFWVGVITVSCLAVVRLERFRRWGALAGIVAALLGALGARAMILSRASGGTQHGRQTSVARSPLAQLQHELTAPMLDSAGPPPGDGVPIVLLTVDTLRWDAAVEMESTKRLAERGALWERAMSTSSWTVPSVASMMTGEVPAVHGAGVSAEGSFQGLSQDIPTLATALSDVGYRTAAVVTNAWLTGGLGYDRGFHDYAHADEGFHHHLMLTGFPKGAKGHEAEAVVDRAIAWLDDAPDRGWFLWVHLIDPHLPFLHADGKLEAGLSDERLRSGMRLTPDVMERVRAAYAREVRYTDEHLSRLLDVLDAKGVLDEGVIMMTADHGEEFWDHGATGHGHQHHREVVDVAMALSGPGITPGRRSDLASLMDVGATLAAAGGTTLGAGRDLREATPSDRVLVSQGNAYFRQQRSARDAGTRAIVLTEGDGPVACFDVTDSGEAEVSCDGRERVVEAARAARPPEAGADVFLPTEALEALGYVVDDDE